MKSLNTSVVAVLIALIAILIATPAQAGISLAKETLGGKFTLWGGLTNRDVIEVEAPTGYSTRVLSGEIQSQFSCGINYAAVTDRLTLGLVVKNGKNSSFGHPDPINWDGQTGSYQILLSPTVLQFEANIQTSWFKMSSLPSWMRFQALAGGHFDFGRTITLKRYDNGSEFSEEIANAKIHDFSLSFRTGTGTTEIGMVWLAFTLGRKIVSISHNGGFDYLDIRSKSLTTVTLSLGISR